MSDKGKTEVVTGTATPLPIYAKPDVTLPVLVQMKVRDPNTGKLCDSPDEFEKPKKENN